MKLLLRFLGFLFAAGTILFIVGIAARGRLVVALLQGLAGLFAASGLRAAGDDAGACRGRLAAGGIRQGATALSADPGDPEARHQCLRRRRRQEFLSASRHRHSRHHARRLALSSQNYGHGGHPQGASTITQQVAKNFLLTNEVSFERKIKEALLALRIERTYSKPKILELYLNEIYLGFGAYGVAAASLLYFDKSVHELTIAEAAYLAALPKGPNNYNPFRQHDEAIARRNYVIDRMAEDGYITAAEADKAKKAPLDVTVRPTGAHIFAAEYFSRGSAALSLRQLRREEALRGRAVGAHHARSEIADDGAQDHGQRARQFRREPGLSRRRHHDRCQRRLGRQARRREIARRHRAVAAWRWCSRSTINRRASACSRRAIRAAPWSRTARSASCRSTA